MSTGENEQALRKIIDFTRFGSLIILAILFYISCYGAFATWHLVHPISDKIFINVSKISVFHNPTATKFIVLLLLGISLIGVKGVKNEKINKRHIAIYVISGLAVFFAADLFLKLRSEKTIVATLYMVFSSAGYVLILTGGTLISRLIKLNMADDLFNNLAETFPQEERLLENQYSFNLPARYNYQGKVRNSWVNFVNPHRAIMVLGSAGSGKSLFVVNPILRQSIQKRMALLLYDFKIPDLSIIAYNAYLKYRHTYEVEPTFHVINFDDLEHSNQCNPIPAESMKDITDASESARTIMMGLNKEFLKKQGDFFVESSINFLTAIIWFLRNFEDGKFCSLPHAIELAQFNYDELFSVLRTGDVEALISPFIYAYINGAAAQLEGQIASAKIGLARIASPQIYWVLSGSDFSLELNDPAAPKILCVGNNPQKQQVYGPILGLYFNRITKLINKKNRIPLLYAVDELPTITLLGLDNLMATARSNKVTCLIALQTYEMLKRDYGQEQAEVIMNLPGNVISGQTFGETAKQLTERFGKIMQARQSKSINSNDISVSHSTQLESAIPASKISNLTSGQFVGLVADNPGQRIEQKIFNCELQVDFDSIKKEEDAYEPLPFMRKVTNEMEQENYQRIKREAQYIITMVLEKLRSDPGLSHLLIMKD